jgi:signal transduction histidine kinase
MGIAAAGAAVFTLVVTVTSSIRFAYANASLHAAVEAVAAVIAIVAAQLIYGRFRQSLQVRDLLLTAALTVFAVANLFFSAIPAVVDHEPGPFATWAPACGRLLGTALMALAAVVPNRTLHRPMRDARELLAACLLLLGAIVATVAIVGDALPRAIPPDLSPESAGRPRIVGNPIVLGVELSVMLLFAVAAVGFGRLAERTGDEFMRWLAIASTLGAFSRLNFFLFPSLYSAFFYTGDVLRLAFFLALAVGGALEMRRTREQLATAAVLEERERIARDIHDGVAQDLAFILQHGRRLGEQTGAPPGIRNLVIAAERALDECRHAIAALARASDEPLHEALTLTALETAGREGAMVETDLDQQITVPAATQQALLRVLREAITNAIRHGGAKRIKVELSAQPELRLVVRDDGSGFDVEAAVSSPGRLGLRSMEARIRAVSGELTIESEPGHGTRVLVRLP